MTNTIEEADKPIIAVINGFCLGEASSSPCPAT